MKQAKTDKERRQRRRAVLRRYEQSAKGKANILRYRRRLRARLVASFGGKCSKCGKTKNLEFAHIKPTPIVFTKVGKRKERDSSITSKARDIREHRDCYRLLCVFCHENFDRSQNGYKRQPGAFRNRQELYGSVNINT